jgi:methionine-rich copper-binding protein CopC
MIIARRRILTGLALLAPVPAWADDVRVMDSQPTAKAVIGEPGSSFFVRFDRPIDHIQSRLSIYRDGQLVERLEPRLQTEPNILFARAPTLPPGEYTMHWVVRTFEGAKVEEGSIPFMVKRP